MNGSLFQGRTGPLTWSEWKRKTNSKKRRMLVAKWKNEARIEVELELRKAAYARIERLEGAIHQMMAMPAEERREMKRIGREALGG